MLINIDGVPTVYGFSGEYSWLSNFYECFLTVDGIPFTSSEAAYVSLRTHDRETRIRISNMSPGEAKRFGRSPGFPTRDDWEDYRVLAMLRVLSRKFSYNSELHGKLIETEDLVLVESNTWGDTFWGVNSRTGKGSNMLGNLLMFIRDET